LSHVPFQVGVQFLRHQLLLLSTEFIRRLKIREGEPPGEPKSGAGAKCGVQLLKAEKFFGSAEALPSKTTYHSLLAIRHSLPFNQSPFAVHYSLLTTHYSPSFRLGRSLALPLFLSMSLFSVASSMRLTAQQFPHELPNFSAVFLVHHCHLHEGFEVTLKVADVPSLFVRFKGQSIDGIALADQ
jgi:hypothetical protein